MIKKIGLLWEPLNPRRGMGLDPGDSTEVITKKPPGHGHGGRKVRFSLGWRVRWPILLIGPVVLIWGGALWIGKDALLGWLDSLPPTCPLKSWFGFKCAFCGMTHAMIRILFFDFRGATAENLLSVPLAGVSLTVLGLAAFSPVRLIHRKGLAWSALGILCSYAIFRNI